MPRWQTAFSVLFVLACCCSAALSSSYGDVDWEEGEVRGAAKAHRRGETPAPESTASDTGHTSDEGEDVSIWGAVGVVSICAGSMVVGVLSMLFVRIPPKVEAATQNFSAGILIAAIAGELFPLLHKPNEAHGREEEGGSSIARLVGTIIGFIFGIGLMFGQKHLLEQHQAEKPADKQGLAKIDDILVRLPTQKKLEEVKKREEEGESVESVTTPADDRALPNVAMLAELKGRLSDRANSKRQLQDAVVQRMVSEQSAVNEAIRDVMEMKDLSLKVHSILTSSWREATARDELDDELSGVLRRCVRGAEPMSKKQVREVSERMKRVDDALNRLQDHLNLPSVDLKTIDTALAAVEEEITGMISANIDHVECFRRWQATAPMEGPKTEVIPWSLVIGVAIDCLTDGLLVGLTFMASARAGYIMALATSIESCFLGLSLSSSVYNSTANRVRHVSISCIPVMALLVGGVIAGVTGHALESNTLAFACFISFAIVALLFLVTQELLLTAHEITNQQEIWYINMNLFLGVGMVVLLEQVLH